MPKDRHDEQAAKPLLIWTYDLPPLSNTNVGRSFSNHIWFPGFEANPRSLLPSLCVKLAVVLGNKLLKHHTNPSRWWSLSLPLTRNHVRALQRTRVERWRLYPMLSDRVSLPYPAIEWLYAPRNP
jgi:hypothetical protein